MHYCIIGTQINSLHAALLAIEAGHEVSLYLDLDKDVTLDDPTHGIFRVRNREVIENLYGPLVDLGAPEQALFWDGQTHKSRLRKRSMLRSGSLGSQMLQDLQKARIRLKFSNFTGDAKEERSMANWLERRLGGVATKHIYEPYASQRWGTGLDMLSNTLARHHFFQQEAGDYCAIGGTYASALQGLLSKVKNKIQFHTSLPLKVDKIAKEQWSITTNTGIQSHNGPLLVCLAPQHLQKCFAVNKSVEVDLDALQFSHLQLASIRVEGHHNIHDLHVFDPELPFFRVCFPYGQKEQAYLHLKDGQLSDEEIASSFHKLGIGNLVGDMHIERITLKDHTPIWTIGCLARHRRLIRHFESESVFFFGRHGLFTELTLPEELDYLDSLFRRPDVDAAEHQRVFLYPKPRIEDYNVEIGMVYR